MQYPLRLFKIFQSEAGKMEDKITDIEIRIAHQEAAIEEINKTILKQHNQIESLITDLSILRKQLKDVSENNIVDQSDEAPPPHY